MKSSMIPVEIIALRWERAYGAHPGAVAQYGPYFFRVYRWQKGCYIATVADEGTKTTLHTFGENAANCAPRPPPVPAPPNGSAALRAQDRAQGIRRFA
jgi:hypothetical protein